MCSSISVRNGVGAGFCRLQLPEVLRQGAEAGSQANHISLLPSPKFSLFLSLCAVLFSFLV